MRIDPEDAARSLRLRETAQRADRNGVVAAEHERHASAGHRRGHELRDPLAGREDLRQEACVLVPHLGRLRHGRVDVPAVLARSAEALDPRVEACVADRGRAHVDPTAPGAEVERRPDHGDRLLRLHRHGGQG